MDGSSISNPYIIVDVDDHPYFPPLVSRDPISDQKYAEQLQLHEALVFVSSTITQYTCHSDRGSFHAS
ncbi:hypothetical protein Tco_0342137 [Tanacetum coccineum]